METVKVIISEKGVVTVEVIGVKGRQCLGLLDNIDGEILEQKKTHEFLEVGGGEGVSVSN